jgi:hypothetical protein
MISGWRYHYCGFVFVTVCYSLAFSQGGGLREDVMLCLM